MALQGLDVHPAAAGLMQGRNPAATGVCLHTRSGMPAWQRLGPGARPGERADDAHRRAGRLGSSSDVDLEQTPSDRNKGMGWRCSGRAG